MSKWNESIQAMTRSIMRDEARACNCIGPQNGEPLCPCAMRGVQIINGRYVKTQDLGPAPTTKEG